MNKIKYLKVYIYIYILVFIYILLNSQLLYVNDDVFIYIKIHLFSWVIIRNKNRITNKLIFKE